MEIVCINDDDSVDDGNIEHPSGERKEAIEIVKVFVYVEADCLTNVKQHD